MNLREIRDKFVEMSGREDLASTSDASAPHDTDAGADWFINGGSRWLDLQMEHAQQEAEAHFSLGQNDYKFGMTYCRAVRKVWLLDSENDNKLVELTRKSLRWMKEKYPAMGGSDTGAPAYWTPVTSRRAPSEYGAGGNSSLYDVLVMPPADVEYQFEVEGLFHSKPLELNTDENYWSVNYEDLLVLTALMRLEGFYRNTAGYKDFQVQVLEILNGIDADVVEAVTGDEDTMFMEG